MLLGRARGPRPAARRLREELGKLPLAGYRLEAQRVHRVGPRTPPRSTWSSSRRTARPAAPRTSRATSCELLDGARARGRGQGARGGALPPAGRGRGRRPRHVARGGPLPRGRGGRLDRGRRGRRDRPAWLARRSLRVLAAERRHGHGHDVARHVPGAAAGHGAARAGRAGLRRGRGRAADADRRAARDRATPRPTARCRRCGSRRSATAPARATRRAGPTCCA